MGNYDETEPLTSPKSDETEPPLGNQSLSDEIETNQSLQSGASQPKWENIQPLDLHTPKRREQLYHAALASGVIRPTEAHRHTFFAAVAHATRVARKNPCGLLRRLVETPAYHGFISQHDEDQASSWLHTHQPQFPPCIQSPAKATNDPHDRQIVSYLRNRLHNAGFPTDNSFALIMTTHEGKMYLAGWTQDRWDRAASGNNLRTRAPLKTAFIVSSMPLNGSATLGRSIRARRAKTGCLTDDRGAIGPRVVKPESDGFTAIGREQTIFPKRCRWKSSTGHRGLYLSKTLLTAFRIVSESTSVSSKETLFTNLISSDFPILFVLDEIVQM